MPRKKRDKITRPDPEFAPPSKRTRSTAKSLNDSTKLTSHQNIIPPELSIDCTQYNDQLPDWDKTTVEEIVYNTVLQNITNLISNNPPFESEYIKEILPYVKIVITPHAKFSTRLVSVGGKLITENGTQPTLTDTTAHTAEIATIEINPYHADLQTSTENNCITTWRYKLLRALRKQLHHKGHDIKKGLGLYKQQKKEWKQLAIAYQQAGNPALTSDNWTKEIDNALATVQRTLILGVKTKENKIDRLLENYLNPQLERGLNDHLGLNGGWNTTQGEEALSILILIMGKEALKNHFYERNINADSLIEAAIQSQQQTTSILKHAREHQNSQDPAEKAKAHQIIRQAYIGGANNNQLQKTDLTTLLQNVINLQGEQLGYSPPELSENKEIQTAIQFSHEKGQILFNPQILKNARVNILEIIEHINKAIYTYTETAFSLTQLKSNEELINNRSKTIKNTPEKHTNTIEFTNPHQNPQQTRTHPQHIRQPINEQSQITDVQTLETTLDTWLPETVGTPTDNRQGQLQLQKYTTPQGATALAITITEHSTLQTLWHERAHALIEIIKQIRGTKEEAEKIKLATAYHEAKEAIQKLNEEQWQNLTKKLEVTTKEDYEKQSTKQQTKGKLTRLLRELAPQYISKYIAAIIENNTTELASLESISPELKNLTQTILATPQAFTQQETNKLNLADGQGIKKFKNEDTLNMPTPTPTIQEPKLKEKIIEIHEKYTQAIRDAVKNAFDPQAKQLLGAFLREKQLPASNKIAQYKTAFYRNIDTKKEAQKTKFTNKITAEENPTKLQHLLVKGFNEMQQALEEDLKEKGITTETTIDSYISQNARQDPYHNLLNFENYKLKPKEGGYQLTEVTKKIEKTNRAKLKSTLITLEANKIVKTTAEKEILEAMETGTIDWTKHFPAIEAVIHNGQLKGNEQQAQQRSQHSDKQQNESLEIKEIAFNTNNILEIKNSEVPPLIVEKDSKLEDYNEQYFQEKLKQEIINQTTTETPNQNKALGLAHHLKQYQKIDPKKDKSYKDANKKIAKKIQTEDKDPIKRRIDFSIKLGQAIQAKQTEITNILWPQAENLNEEYQTWLKEIATRPFTQQDIKAMRAIYGEQKTPPSTTPSPPTYQNLKTFITKYIENKDEYQTWQAALQNNPTEEQTLAMAHHLAETIETKDEATKEFKQQTHQALIIDHLMTTNQRAATQEILENPKEIKPEHYYLKHYVQNTLKETKPKT